MSNPERNPDEVTCERRDDLATGASEPVVLPYRHVPLGGPRAMPVRRSLPQRERSLIGAWCFVDHYGPDDVSQTGGMVVPGHPHTGLQTVSWLFSGEVEHRDTTGAHAFVRPGELNIMTAGNGIAHSEYSTPSTTVLHGAQLWVALPSATRFARPGFEHYAPPVVDVDGCRVLVFLGTLFGQTSPVTMHSDLVGAEATVPAGSTLAVDLDPSHEHGFLCDTGTLTVGTATAKPGEIVFQPLGATQVTLEAGDEDTRVLVLGGAPFGEQIVMWWNFIGRSHEEIVEFRDQWQRERAGAEAQRISAETAESADGATSEAGEAGEADGADDAATGERRYGSFPAAWEHTLPAPELPNLRLRSRG